MSFNKLSPDLNAAEFTKAPAHASVSTIIENFKVVFKTAQQSDHRELLNLAILELKIVTEISQKALVDIDHLPKILIVDDSEILLQATVEVLRKNGYRAVGVSDGAAAICALNREQFDLVIMDCQMSVMDGFKATHHIRTKDGIAYHDIPIVGMSRNLSSRNADMCIDMGMDDFLTKPVETKRLITTVEKWLELSAQRRRPRFPAPR